jgi:O-succinylbenzoate synthase
MCCNTFAENIFEINITIRLDANGAFKKEEALYKLTELSRFDIHSIEQPIKPGTVELAELCQQSPIPIALDEELIGVDAVQQQNEHYLNRIKTSKHNLKTNPAWRPSVVCRMDSGCEELGYWLVDYFCSGE